MNRMLASPLISKGLEIAENHLGIDELAKKLHTVPSVVHAWRMGQATMPQYKFLRLVDLLTGPTRPLKGVVAGISPGATFVTARNARDRADVAEGILNGVRMHNQSGARSLASLATSQLVLPPGGNLDPSEAQQLVERQ